MSEEEKKEEEKLTYTVNFEEKWMLNGFKNWLSVNQLVAKMHKDIFSIENMPVAKPPEESL